MVCFEKLPIVNRFLCCIALDTGCAILGILTLLTAWTIFIGIVLLEFGDSLIANVTHSGGPLDRTSFYFIAVISAILLPITVASILLIFGVVKKSCKLLRLHLWLDVILTLTVGTCMVVFVMLVISIGPEYGSAVVVLIVAFAFKVYFFICVNSYYVDLIRRAERATYAANFNLATAPPPPIIPQSHMYPHIYYTQGE